MLHVFILNPFAGKAPNFKKLEEEIKALFAKKKEKYVIEYTKYAGHAKDIALAYEQSKEAVRFYACGGDGTLFETVNGAYTNPNAEVAPVPCGSGNDFVKLYDRKRRPTLEEMVEGESVRVDLIRCDHEVALNCASAGLDAEVAGMIAKLKRMPLMTGSSAYILAAVTKLLRNKKHRFAFEIDGKEYAQEKLMFAALMNGRYYGGGFNPTPNAKLNDGKLDFVRVKAMNYFQIAGLVGKYKNGTHMEHSKGLIDMLNCSKVKFLSKKPILVTLDGEMRLKNSPTFELLSKAVGIVLPRWEGVKENLLINCED